MHRNEFRPGEQRGALHNSLKQCGLLMKGRGEIFGRGMLSPPPPGPVPSLAVETIRPGTGVFQAAEMEYFSRN